MLIELLQQLNCLILHDALSDLISTAAQLVQRENRAVAPEFIVFTAEHYFPDTWKLQSIGTHDAGFHGYIESAFWKECFIAISANLSDAIYFAVSRCLLIKRLAFLTFFVWFVRLWDSASTLPLGECTKTHPTGTSLASKPFRAWSTAICMYYSKLPSLLLSSIILSFMYK